MKGAKDAIYVLSIAPTKCLALNTSYTNSYRLYYAYLVDEEKCIGCVNCAVMCPDAAITVYKKAS